MDWWKQGRHPGTNQLDFGGNPDLDPDSGNFDGNFTTVILAMLL